MINLYKILTVLAVQVCVIGCASNPAYLASSKQALGVPEQDLSFEQYVAQSQQQILEVLQSRQTPSHYQGDYSQQQAAQLRAPFQILPGSTEQCQQADSGSKQGFLLIHGLTDSPYLMRAIAQSIHFRFPCASIRAIVLPGHSTIPGDTLSTQDMSFKKWLAATDYGLKSFDALSHVESVNVITFSTGAPLIIRHLAEQGSQKVKSVVMLSAAIKAKDKRAFLAPFVANFVDWTDKTNEQDAVRYESFSYHAGAQFYKLTKVLDQPQYLMHRPLFVVISADDATVSAQAALEYFCQSPTPNKQMIWYEHQYTLEPLSSFETITAQCKSHISVRKTEQIDRPENFVSFSHTSLSMPPDDPHYGAKANYKQCKSYFNFEDPHSVEFNSCLAAIESGVVIGEGTEQLREYASANDLYWQRGTYNPDYAYMTSRILAFLESIE